MNIKIRSALRSWHELVMRSAAWCLLVPVILAFLIRNRRLFDAPLVMPFYTHSFGHSFQALDVAARLYANSRISLVMVRDPNQNAFLPAMFRESMTLYWVDTLGFSPRTVGAVLRALVYMLCPFFGGASLIELDSVYRAMTRLPERVVGSEERDQLIATPHDLTGYVYLLEHGIGPRPSLPPDLMARCRSFIAARYPDFFSRPFITVLLRAKGQDAPELSARCRSSGPMENYRPAVAHAIARGYHVVGTGETVNSVFADMPGFFDLGEMRDAPGLVNVFLLSHCSLFLGQQSGPVVVPNSCGIPCLITDALPHRHGAYGQTDIVLYKPVTLEGEKNPLNLVDIYTHHKDLAYGYGFERKRATIGCNSAQELLQAIEEALDRLVGPPPFDVLKLASQWRELIEPSMPVHFHPSRPPEFVLRSLPLNGYEDAQQS